MFGHVNINKFLRQSTKVAACSQNLSVIEHEIWIISDTAILILGRYTKIISTAILKRTPYAHIATP